VQKTKKGGKAVEAQALVQVRSIVKHISPKFGNVMQKDLFDLLGEFDADEPQKGSLRGATAL